jgi:hypothetical protein
MFMSAGGGTAIGWFARAPNPVTASDIPQHVVNLENGGFTFWQHGRRAQAYRILARGRYTSNCGMYYLVEINSPQLAIAA